jgi:NADH dehydrogenase (ubiquinone) flavoprotein 2
MEFVRRVSSRSAHRSISSSRLVCSDKLFVHRNSPSNDPKTPFEFTKEFKLRADKIISQYPAQYKKGACMPLLDLGQRQHGFTSLAVMNHVAKLLDMAPMRVYEVATFYTMYNRDPVGKVIISY